MNVDLNNLSDNFIIRPCVIAGDECSLIFPKHIGCTWDKENLIYRSLIVRNSDGKKLSNSFTKFFNHGEKPDLYPDPTNFKNGWTVSEKLDGATVIVSRFKGELIVRTRGTVDVMIHETGEEIMSLVNRIPNLKEFLKEEKYTLLFEYVSPNHQVVIRYDKPELILLEIIENDSYKYMEPSYVDSVAVALNLARPKIYEFNTIKEIVENCAILEGVEGYVLSYNHNQNRVKLKSNSYCLMHRLKDRLRSFDHIVDYWMANNKPENLFALIEKEIDWETARSSEKHIDQLYKLWDEYKTKRSSIVEFVEGIRGLKRAEAAGLINSTYDGLYKSLAFTLLSGKIEADTYIKKVFEKYHEIPETDRSRSLD